MAPRVTVTGKLISGKKKDNLLLAAGHRYAPNRKLREKNKIYYRCALVKQCNATAMTAFITEANSEVEVTLGKPHLHAADEAAVEIAERRERINERARRSPNLRPLQILREEMATIAREEVVVRFPSRQTMLRGINRAQNRARPRNPRDLVELEILPPYDRTSLNEIFLQFDHGDGDSRTLIFYTIQSLQHLCQSPQLFCDGTFKSAPKLFYQLFSLHGTVNGYTFPLVYCITTKKCQATYREIFTHLKQHSTALGFHLTPQRITCDFELATINAIKEVFPETSIGGCLFHFSQAIYRHAVNKCGLKVPYDENPEVKEAVSYLFAMPFIPIPDLIEAFNMLYADLPDIVRPLYAYFRKNFLGVPARGRRRRVEPRYSPDIWNMYVATLNMQARTNNVVESWNGLITKNIETAHANVWKFIEAIKKEERDNGILIMQARAGHTNIKHPIQKKVVEAQKYIEVMVGRYYQAKEGNQIKRYLRTISYRLKKPVIRTDDASDEEE